MALQAGYNCALNESIACTCTSGHVLQHYIVHVYCIVDHMMSEEELANEDSGSPHEREFEEDIFNPESTPVIGVGDEGSGASQRILTRQELGYFEEEEEGEEGDASWKDAQVPRLLGLATAARWVEGKEEEEEEEDDSPSPTGLPGTTPPAGSRFMKHSRRTHKYKGGKKLSLGHVPKSQYRDCFKKRPHSMITLSSSPLNEGAENGEERSRRYTAPSLAVGIKSKKMKELKGGRKKHGGSGGSGGGGGHQSPRHTPSDEKTLQKKKKKQTQRKITHDRDKKQVPNPPTICTPRTPPSERTTSLGLPVQSVDLPDYTPSVYRGDESPTDPLSFSLHLQPPRRSSSAGLKLDFDLPAGGNIYRSYSDAHTSLFSTGRQQLPQQTNVRCPPDRKQFFRRFQKALKYAAGISRPPIQPLETPLHPHLSRYYSENLGLENPRGNVLSMSILYMYVGMVLV